MNYFKYTAKNPAFHCVVVTALVLLLSACSLGNQSSKLDENQLQALGTQYLEPAFYSQMTTSSWTDAAEISPDSFLFFYRLVTTRPSSDFIFDSPEDFIVDSKGDGWIPQEYLETFIPSYFNITVECMRKGEYYNPNLQGYLAVGLGGASSCSVTDVKLEGEELAISFEGFQDGELYQTGVLILQRQDDIFMYKGCSVEPHDNQLSSEPEPEPSPTPNPLMPKLEKVVVQVPSTDTPYGALRIMEASGGTLHALADRISGVVLKAVVWEQYDITAENVQSSVSDFVALAESDEEVVFEDERYYQATDSSSSWIRLYYTNFSPKGTPAGGEPPSHKDIVVWIDSHNPDDALFAWQSLDTPSSWTIYRLTGFGDWLRIELMFCNR